MKLSGCRVGNLISLKVTDKQNNITFEKSNFTLMGNLKGEMLTHIQLNESVKLSPKGKIVTVFQCDPEWSGIGKSFLTPKRIYNTSHNYMIRQVDNTISPVIKGDNKTQQKK